MKTGMKCALFACALSSTPGGAAETTTFQYDAQGRLTQSSRSGGPATGTVKSTSYDRAGNRTNQTVTGAGSAMMSGGMTGGFSVQSMGAGQQDELVNGDDVPFDPPVSEGAPHVGDTPPEEVEPVQGELVTGEDQ